MGQDSKQMSMLDRLCPPRPDFVHGRCDCGWILAGWHVNALDRPGWRRVRHLWIFMPEDFL